MDKSKNSKNKKIKFFIGIFISIFNAIIKVFARKAASYGLYITEGELEFQMIWKAGFAYFTNTTIITFLFKYTKFDSHPSEAIYGENGLIPYVFAIFTTNIII